MCVVHCKFPAEAPLIVDGRPDVWTVTRQVVGYRRPGYPQEGQNLAVTPLVSAIVEITHTGCTRSHMTGG